jgi:hypothetical protein
VISTAKGISLLNGAVQIGAVTTTATSQAHGRAGTAKSTLSRTVSNVQIQGTEYCTSQCDANALAALINAQFAGLLRLDLPGADPTYEASSGGYQAIIRRPLAAQIQEADLNDQATDRTEVPAMVVTQFVGDNRRPARIVTYIAGAETEARYGIYALDQSVAQPVPGTDFGTGLPASSGGNASLIDSAGGGSGGAPTGGGTGTNPVATHGGGHPRSPLAGLLPPGGWRWIAAHPVAAMKLLFMWAVLLSPVYVAARRWLLLQRNRVLQEAMA